MWFAVKNQGKKKEEDFKTILMANISHVKDVYLPYIHRVYKDKHGVTRRRYELAAKGYMFVNVDIDDGVRNKHDIWEKLSKYITAAGYFYWYVDDIKDGESVPTRVTEPVRLLSSDPKTATPDEFIGNSYIPDQTMENFRNFNDQSLGGNVDAFLVNESFNKMARVNDVVRIISGPLAGEEGVIVQENEGDNRRDRRLVAKFGNCMTVHYPNIRKYNMIVVREAKEGEKSKQSRLWYIIDRLIGNLQKERKDNVDDSVRDLRNLITNINKLSENDTEGKMKIINDAIKSLKVSETKDIRRSLFLLASVFPPSTNSKFDSLLLEYIPDARIRPFLTPAFKVSPVGKLYEDTLKHKDFTERIIQVNLEDTFKEALEKDNSSADAYPKDSFIYDAHVAIFDQDNKIKKAVVSWGGFYDKYEALEEAQKKDFIDDLEKKNYKYLHSLLSNGIPFGEVDQTKKIAFDKTKGIGGFSIVFSEGQDEPVNYLVHNVAKAAVEMWQGTRLKDWRKLVQRFVLIHNINL